MSDIFYKLSKSKFTKAYRETMTYNQLYDIASSKFIYSDLPDTIPQELIESCFICEGICAVGNINGKLYAATGGYCGEILDGFLPSEYQGAVKGVGNFRGVIGKDVAVAWNNNTCSPDLDIIEAASALTEVYTSEDINVIFSRLLRIPIAKDSKDKAVIEAAIKAITEGKIEAVSSGIKLDDVLGNQDNSPKFLDLVDVKDVDKLQYLNQYYDNRFKRFLQHHGVPMQITAKLAQQTTTEIQGADAYSIIYPLQQLKRRKQFCEDINRIFGTNVSVSFTEVWQEAYDRYINYTAGDENNEKEVLDNENKSSKNSRDTE